MRIANLKSGEIRNISLPFVIPEGKATVHIQDDFYLAGGINEGVSSDTFIKVSLEG